MKIREASQNKIFLIKYNYDVNTTHILQMFIPNWVELYGSQVIKPMEISLSNDTCYNLVIVMRKTRLKALDRPEERCDSNTRHPNTSQCIARYIERRIGCSMKIHGGGSTDMPPCTLKSEEEAFKRITTQLENANANYIYELTGCLASCERNEYGIKDEHFILKNGSECYQQGQPHYDMQLDFWIMTGSYKEEEQYVIYDFNSFIADVGGFLGLLLGYSALSLYDEFESLLRVLKLKSLLK